MDNIPQPPDSPQDRLEALRADEADGGLRPAVSPHVLRLARATWDAAESFDRRRGLLPVQTAIVQTAIRAIADVDDEDSRLALGVALVRLLWGEELLVDPSRERALEAAIGCVLLAARTAAARPDEAVLPAFVREVCRQAATLELGPGWDRRAKGLEVALTDTVSQPTGDPDTRLRIAELREKASERERDVLDVLWVDPEATAQHIAEVLGCPRETVRDVLKRVKGRASSL